MGNVLYGVELPSAEGIKKLAKDYAKLCDANVKKIAEIDAELKKIAKDAKTADASAKKELSERKAALKKERDLVLIKAKVNEANADSYADVYEKVTGSQIEGLRKTDRIFEYKKLSDAEMQEMVIRVWTNTKKPTKLAPVEKKPAEKKTPEIKIEKAAEPEKLVSEPQETECKCQKKKKAPVASLIVVAIAVLFCVYFFIIR